MKKISLYSPAKINLSLKIGKMLPCSLRENEILHTIESTLIRIPLADEIVGERIPQKKIEMFFSGPHSKKVPNNDHNLVYRAGKLFFGEVGFSEGIRVHVVKNIPLASGLGGGSSNAATILHALRKLFPEKSQEISSATWNEMCVKLGSDVSFFFSGFESAEVSGFGEQVKEVPFSPLKPLYGVVAMLKRITSATSWAYKELDKSQDVVSEAEFKKVKNDFEIPIFSHFPDLEKLRDDFLKYDAIVSGLTGSGSAIFAFFKNQESFLKAEQTIMSKCHYWQAFEL